MKKKILPLALSAIFILLLLFPKTVQSGAREGLFLWYSTMIPILFPFILVSNLFLMTDSIRYFTYPFFPLSKRLPGFSPYYPYALIFGWFCGYPMGAKTVADLYRSQKITAWEANFLLPAANQASPMFLMGYLGIHIFRESLSFSRILFFVYFPVAVYFCLGILFFHFLSYRPPRPLYNKKGGRRRTLPLIFFPKKETGLTASELTGSIPFSMEDSILSSFHIIVNIGVYMMVFAILMRLLLDFFPDSAFVSVLAGFLEMSTGISWLNSLTGLPIPLRFSLILSTAAFGGLCTCAQTAGVTEGLGLSMPFYLAGKLFLGMATFFLAMLFL